MLSLAFGNAWFTYRHFNQLMYVMKHKSEAVKTAAVILSHMQKDDENFKMPQKTIIQYQINNKNPVTTGWYAGRRNDLKQGESIDILVYPNGYFNTLHKTSPDNALLFNIIGFAFLCAVYAQFG
jgi:hypothetical protein